MKKKIGFAVLILLLMLVTPFKVKAASNWMYTIKPYQYTNTTEYLPTSTKSFAVGGQKNNEGYTFYLWNAARTSQVLYNLKGEYSSFTFKIGHVDGTNNYSAKLVVYLDGKPTQTIALSPSDISKTVSLTLNDVKQLKLALESDEALNHYDITYGIFDGQFVKNGYIAKKSYSSSLSGNFEPYNTDNKVSMIYKKDGKSITMAGDDYSDAIQFYMWNTYEGRSPKAYFNLGGKYESLSFVFGHIDNTVRASASLKIEVDGSVVQTIENQADDLPKSVSVSLKGAHQLILSLHSEEPLNTYDLYYGIGSVVLKSDGKVTGITLNQQSFMMSDANRSFRLKANVLPDNAVNTNVKWSSSDTSVAKVNSEGVVTAIGSGSAVITATTEDGGYTAECNVTVSISVPKVTPTPSGTVYVKPSAPKLYSAVFKKATSVQLKWNRSSNAKGYEVYYSTAQNAGYKRLAVLQGGTRTSFVASKLKAGKAYYFKVRAYNGNKKSAFSAVIRAVPKPGKAVITSISNSKKNVINLKWKKISGSSGYEIYLKTPGASKYTDLGSTSYNNVYIKGNFTKGKYYYCKVRAYRIVNGEKVYGDYSAAKYVKIRK